MQIDKLFKWSASSARVAATKARLGRRLHLSHGGNPVYLGRGARLVVEENGVMGLGRGSYIDDCCRLRALRGVPLAKAVA